jgi:uncharacterized membrane protein AbrB (regulator of aidB expression)
MSSEHKEEKKTEKKSLVAMLIGVTGAIIAIWVFLIINGVTLPQAIAAGGNMLTESGRALSTFGTAGNAIASGLEDTKNGFVRVLMVVFVFILVGSVLSFAIVKVAKVAGDAIKKTLKGGDGHH